MTKEKLEKEAYEYFKSICDDYNEELERTGKRHYWVGFDIENAYIAGAEPREKRIEKLEAQIEKMKKYIKACWVEENLNDYSSYITNSSDEFRDLVKELNDEVRNGK